MPSDTAGNVIVHGLGDSCAIMAAFRLRVIARCTVSDDAKLVTQIIRQSGFELSASIRGDSGWKPEGAIHPLKKALVTVSALMSTNDMASGQRVKRSTQVNKYLKPSEYGKGPTMSMWTWSNLSAGSVNFPKTYIKSGASDQLEGQGMAYQHY